FYRLRRPQGRRQRSCFVKLAAPRGPSRDNAPGTDRGAADGLMSTYHRRYEGQMEQLAAIREFVQGAAIALGSDGDDAVAGQVVAGEAAHIAFADAYGGQPGRVDVTLRREGDTLVMCVRDWGPGFDPEAVPQPDLRRPLTERPPGGMGLLLIRKF